MKEVDSIASGCCVILMKENDLKELGLFEAESLEG